MNYAALGAQIRKRRKEARLSLKSLSQQIGITASFLGLIERGERKASMETLVKIANAFHSGLDALMVESLRSQPHVLAVTEEELQALLPILTLLRERK